MTKLHTVTLRLSRSAAWALYAALQEAERLHTRSAVRRALRSALVAVEEQVPRPVNERWVRYSVVNPRHHLDRAVSELRRELRRTKPDALAAFEVFCAEIKEEEEACATKT
jgi:predicted Zn-dependent protease